MKMISNAPGIDINVLKPGPKAARLVAGTGATSFKLGGSLSGQSLEADSLDSSEQDKGLKKAQDCFQHLVSSQLTIWAVTSRSLGKQPA